MSDRGDDSQLRARIQAFADSAEEPADLQGQPRRIRTFTIVWLLVYAACVAHLAVTLRSTPQTLDWLATIAPSLIFGAISFFAFALMLWTDLSIPSIRDRSRPEQAVRCYLRALDRRQWSRAFGVLAPMATSELLTVPEIPKLRSSRKEVHLRKPRDLEHYWSAILGSGGGYNRRVSRLRIRSTHSDGPVQYQSVELRVSYYPSWAFVGLLAGAWPMLLLILLTSKRHTLTFDMPVVKHKNQWWLVDAGIPELEGRSEPAAPLPTARVL
jgi:hypothetical protein